ncbi:hypothetical protein Tco_0319679 [Tanacetum coccineum]
MRYCPICSRFLPGGVVLVSSPPPICLFVPVVIESGMWLELFVVVVIEYGFEKEDKDEVRSITWKRHDQALLRSPQMDQYIST